MNKSLRIFFSIILLFCISATSLFAQEIDDSDAPGTLWYICEVKGKQNKVGKVFKGPFKSKQSAIATWYYQEITPESKYGIVREKVFITKNPEEKYSDIYQNIKYDFDNERNAAIRNYGIALDKKIEKEFKKKVSNMPQMTETENTETDNIKPVKKETSDRKTYAEVNIEIAPLDEHNLQEKIENEFIETSIEPETEILPEVKIEPAIEVETEPAVEIEPEQVEILEQLNEVLEQVATTPVQRYTKEYLQDYMLPEEIPAPQDTYSVLQDIENPNEADSFGQTLLMKAAKAGNEWQINTLLKAGADVNLKDKDGWTALMYAVRYQEGLKCVEILIDAGADVRVKNNFDLSALVLAACYNNNPELIKKLLSYYFISDKEVLKSFVLLLSTKQSSEYIQIAKINVYLDKSIMLNNFYDGKTPLMYAAQYGNSTKILKLLIDSGAVTTVRSTDGKTVFDYAETNPSLPHDEIYWSLNRK